MPTETQLAEAEVFDAITAVIGAGEVPSTHRVRLALGGRGSPIVLQRFITGYFAAHGRRIATDAPPPQTQDVETQPAPVAAGLAAEISRLTRLAAEQLDEDQAERSRRLDERSLELDARVKVLDDRQQTLDKMQEALGERERKLDEREVLLTQPLVDLRTSYQDAVSQRDQALENLRGQLVDLTGQRNRALERAEALQAAKDDEAHRYSVEREARDEHFRSTEVRLNEMADRAKQETKAALLRIEALQQELYVEREKNRSSGEQVRALQQESSTLRVSLDTVEQALAAERGKHQSTQNKLSASELSLVQHEERLAAAHRENGMLTSLQVELKESLAEARGIAQRLVDLERSVTAGMATHENAVRSRDA